MAERLNQHQLRWQRAAMERLLNGPTIYGGPWVSDGEVRGAIRMVSNSSQAATGTLRALRAVGLVESCETYEGVFWKPSDAAVRMAYLGSASGEDR